VTTVNQNIGTAAAPFVAGDDLTIEFVVPGLDLTGATIRWEAFAWEGGPKYGVPSDTASIVKITGSGIAVTQVAEPAKFEVTLVKPDTAALAMTFFHEAEVTVGGKTYTVARGLLIISYQRVV
jgi:hypothetical protein